MTTQLPYNLEAERSVLGALLLDPDAFAAADAMLDARDFFSDVNRLIYAQMVTIARLGGRIDLVTVRDALINAGHWVGAGGPSYLVALVDGVPRSTGVEHYARIVKEKATLRHLIESAARAITEATSSEHGDDAQRA